jgi:hypothetical protein
LERRRPGQGRKQCDVPIALTDLDRMPTSLYDGVEPVDERYREIALHGPRNGQALGAAWFAVLVPVIAQAP